MNFRYVSAVNQSKISVGSKAEERKMRKWQRGERENECVS
jgi:hypothetical protein